MKPKHLSIIVWLPALIFFVLVGLTVADVTSRQAERSLQEGQPAAPRTYTIAAAGDIACDPNLPENKTITTCPHFEVANALENSKYDALFLLGDLQYTTGLQSDFEKSFVPAFTSVKTPMYVVYGNHDYKSSPTAEGVKATFQKNFPNAVLAGSDGKTYYRTQLGNWQVYVLDSNCEFVGGCDDSSAQYAWLKQEVKTHPSTCSIAMWHHPVLNVGSHSDAPDTARMRQINDLARASGIDVVLNGHDHNYQRFMTSSADGSLRQFVAGMGGAPPYEITEKKAKAENKLEASVDDAYGFLELALERYGYTWKFIDVNKKVLDDGSESCK